MTAQPLWICPNAGATPRTAAEMLAHKYWPGEPRADAPALAGLRFRLVDGVVTYRVDLSPDKTSWAVYLCVDD